MGYLEHAGVGHDRLTKDGAPGQSGRYPWASGDSPYQHQAYGSQAQGFINTCAYLESQGFSEDEIVKAMGCKNKSDLISKKRAFNQIYKDEKAKEIQALHETGKYSNREIAKMISDDCKTWNESSVRDIINRGFTTKQTAVQETAKTLIAAGMKTGYIDVGKGVEQTLGVSRTNLDNAVEYLQGQGWIKVNAQVAQATGVGKTTVMTLVAPGAINQDRIFEVKDYESGETISMTTDEYKEYLTDRGYSNDVLNKNGQPQLDAKLAYRQVQAAIEENAIALPGYSELDTSADKKIGFERPTSIDSDRVKIVYADTPTGEVDAKGRPIFVSDEKESDLYQKRPNLYSEDKHGNVTRPATGIDRDGLMYIRPGVKDLDLGNSTYAQVRINVDDTHYLKGMATYGTEDMFPDGVDVLFNTNKMSSKSKQQVMKPLNPSDEGGIDWTNPFGANIQANGQSYYEDAKGRYSGSELGGDYDPNKRYSLNAVNKVNREGSWEEWSSALSSQMLSKQNVDLIRSQLDKTYSKAEADYLRDAALTNPVIKNKLLLDDAEGFDTDAWDMKAVGFKGQTTKVILPSTTIGDDKCYCPNIKNGEKVALIRYPHAGIFEIPILTNDLTNKECNRMIGKNSTDAICISSASAEKLSGADFDGDTVTMIPLKSAKIQSGESLAGMKGFDAKKLYSLNQDDIVNDARYGTKNKFKGEYTTISNTDKQKYMGIVSNLITDMTLNADRKAEMGISDDEYISDITNAVKFSQVIIDSQKHHLDWKTAMDECDINNIKSKYQVQYNDDGSVKKIGGASTIVSRHKESADETPELADKTYSKRDANGDLTEVAGPWNSGYTIDVNTGEKIWKYSGRTYLDDKGNTVEARVKRGSTKRILFEDSMNLVSDKSNEKEVAYATYSNKMKALANQARKEAVNVDTYSRDPVAYDAYKDVVQSMKADMNEAKKNAAVERHAQILAATTYNQWIRNNPNASKDQVKKVKAREISNARNILGKHKTTIELTPDRWDAIQAHAISRSQLTEMMKYIDTTELREYATPKQSAGLSYSQENRIKALSGRYSNAEIARIIGCSDSTVSKVLNS